jgi:hypothetical protein
LKWSFFFTLRLAKLFVATILMGITGEKLSTAWVLENANVVQQLTHLSLISAASLTVFTVVLITTGEREAVLNIVRRVQGRFKKR